MSSSLHLTPVVRVDVSINRSTEVSGFFQEVFKLAFSNPKKFGAQPIATQWHLVQPTGGPPVHFCLSPHASADLSLTPVGAAIDHATSSVFFCAASFSLKRARGARAIQWTEAWKTSRRPRFCACSVEHAPTIPTTEDSAANTPMAAGFTTFTQQLVPTDYLGNPKEGAHSVGVADDGALAEVARRGEK